MWSIRNLLRGSRRAARLLRHPALRHVLHEPAARTPLPMRPRSTKPRHASSKPLASGRHAARPTQALTQPILPPRPVRRRSQPQAGDHCPRALVCMAARYFTTNKTGMIAKRAHRAVAPFAHARMPKWPSCAGSRDRLHHIAMARRLADYGELRHSCRCGHEDDIQSRPSSPQNFKHFCLDQERGIRPHGCGAGLVAAGKPDDFPRKSANSRPHSGAVGWTLHGPCPGSAPPNRPRNHRRTSLQAPNASATPVFAASRKRAVGLAPPEWLAKLSDQLHRNGSAK